MNALELSKSDLRQYFVLVMQLMNNIVIEWQHKLRLLLIPQVRWSYCGKSKEPERHQELLPLGLRWIFLQLTWIWFESMNLKQGWVLIDAFEWL
jgi:hypothetical protein